MNNEKRKSGSGLTFGKAEKAEEAEKSGSCLTFGHELDIRNYLASGYATGQDSMKYGKG